MDRQTGKKSGVVNLPDGLSLYLMSAGPERKSNNEPAVIIEHGLGGSRFEWLATMRLVADFARVYVYERAGYTPSGPPLSHQPPTLQQSAANLKSLLETARIAPPYILVGHSIGGKLIRQFLADYGKDVVSGMVIVDGSPLTVRMPSNCGELCGSTGYLEVVGVKAHHTIPEDEWEKVENEDPSNAAIQQLELEHAAPDGPGTAGRDLYERLKGRQALGDGRLSVIFADEANDLQKMLDYSIEHGCGSQKARDDARKHLENMSVLDEALARESMELSSNARFVKAEGKLKTHNLHVIDPGFVARQIEWVFSGR
ncbi:Alpha/Beta hydrolase protein [Neohortaea acidophila]|uniref:Alpha/Beta hydrolase protein n=1 Tax=Neohortaea acidophila TaxID=245834 RepID=A0A6A6PH13_9PEZI|nr:Alpha/Beta hydrolase protein [Neohortaea acidophila]KAF2479066.1 Alpha/Beta hydrolase protein [Neohortaea acidophila]